MFALKQTRLTCCGVLCCAGSKATINDSKIQNAAVSAVHVEDGAGVILSGSVLEDSQLSHGVTVCGDSLLAVHKCTLQRNKGNGAALSTGARAAISATCCELNGAMLCLLFVFCSLATTSLACMLCVAMLC